MREQKKTKKQEHLENFEEIYIQTFQETYEHIKILLADQRKVKELLILTYARLYHHLDGPFGRKGVAHWLKETADELAEVKMGIMPEQIKALQVKENIKKESTINKNSPERKRLDETSVFLEITDYLKLDENSDSDRDISGIRLIFKNIISIGLLVAAVAAIVVGVEKIKYQVDLLRAPFLESLSMEEENSLEAQRNKKDHIKIGNKVVYLSDIGQILYSIPLDQTEYASEGPGNPEVQSSDDGWVYYLPCPERTDSVLKNISPDLFHTLYRMKDSREEIEIISREVEDFFLWEGRIYIECFDRVQVIEAEETFEKIVPGVYVHRENCEFYLRDTLGRKLETEKDGNIRYGDRILLMDSDRIADVIPAQQTKGRFTYELKNIEEFKKGIFRTNNGVGELFLQEETTIDSFCIAGDWLYYSAYIRRGGSGAHYSKLFRKSLVEDKKREEIHDEFTGRIHQMYYCQENGQIYGNYTPRNWENNHGVIAVISESGQMSYLKDEEQRAARETTGNDTLEFVMMRNNEVYCYWKDYQWQKDETPQILWRDVLVIPNGSRVRIKD